ncbi:MAG: serine protease, partial [Planctomycetes bacterium]|nr:serine protease [Planctomycetota bacterium]
AQFQRLWAGYDPTARRSPISAESINSAGPACDVALLQLENNEGLAESLPVAPQEVLDKIGPTYPVGYVGYPMEGLAIGGVNPKSPTPTRHLAYISSVTDYFGDANVDSAQRLLVQHALPATGGASGSPIINRDGQVVAVLNAGNVIGITPRGRIGSSANIAFAQRADLVRELLDGSSIRKQVPRLARWKQDLAKNFKPRDVVEVEIKGVRDRIANNTIADWKDTQSGSGDYTVKFETLVDRVLEAKPTAKTDVKLATAGPCFLMAYDASGESPVFVRVVEKDKDKEQTINGSPTNFRWARFLTFDGHSGADVAINVTSDADEAKIAMKLFHAARTRVPPKDRLEKLLEDWKKQIITLPALTVSTEIASESSGTLPEPLSAGQPAVSKIELTLKEAGDYFLFVSTAGDDKIAVVAARRDGVRLVQLVSDQRGNPTAYGSFKVPAGSEMVIFVLGLQKDVPYDLKLYRAVLK